MNQRRETRFMANQSVTITLFDEVDIRITGTIRNISGTGIGLELDRPVRPGTALKVDLDDGPMLGEVIYCHQEEWSYYAGVELEHSLSGLGELSRIVEAFDRAIEPSEQSGPQRTHAVIDGSEQGNKQSR
jgi:hypothetical protein